MLCVFDVVQLKACAQASSQKSLCVFFYLKFQPRDFLNAFKPFHNIS